MKHEWNKPDTSALSAALFERHAKALKRLGEEIALRRTEKSLSVAELAALADVREVAVEKLERGDEVQSQTVRAVLTALDIDLNIIERIY